ncbi:MAG: DUF1592 domain-containing protein [Deltaproteobacteria bacterium]
MVALPVGTCGVSSWQSLLWGGLIPLTLALSCGRAPGASGGDEDRAGAAVDSADTAGAEHGGSAERGAAGDDGCTTQSPPQAPLRRLSRFEYDNTVRDLFGDQSRPARALPVEADQGDVVTARLIEAQHELAHDFAASVTEDAESRGAFIGCDPENDGDAACQRQFITSFVGRAFRRPITTDDLAAFSSVFENGRTLGGDFSSGVRAVIEVAFQSPEFLYRLELGEPAADKGPGWARPSAYEMASRLSYLFWGSAPDAELLDAARRDALRSPEELEAQARRLLAHDRARAAVGNFYLRLLGLVDPAFPAAGGAEHPSFTPEIAALLTTETEAFTADLTLGGDGDFRALLTAPYTFVNGPLADFYGISGISGSEFQRAEVDGSQRGGLLTQASFLARSTLGPSTNPSRRGHAIATAFLCLGLPSEHDVGDVPTPPAPGLTTRQRFEAHSTTPQCAGCHVVFDPIGFAFEHFDTAGLWRDTENGLAIDTSGEIIDTDAAGPFDGALELSQRIAESDDARRCFVENWFAHAHGRAATSRDACSLETLQRTFRSEAWNLRELLVALTRDDAFLHLAEVAP